MITVRKIAPPTMRLRAHPICGGDGLRPPNNSLQQRRWQVHKRGARRHATASLKNAQVPGRASGVCCERGWAAGLGSGAAGGRPPPMRAWARRYRQAYRVLPAAPHATDGARPTQRWSAPHATAARSGPHAAALATHHAHGRTTLGLRDRPTTRFSSTAGRCNRPRRATARDGALKNAQVWGRASGVCCERGWAATWAAGRRAGAHRTCGRYARRVWPAAPRRPAARRTRRRPPAAAFQKPPTRKRRDPAPTRRHWRRATRMAGKHWG